MDSEDIRQRNIAAVLHSLKCEASLLCPCSASSCYKLRPHLQHVLHCTTSNCAVAQCSNVKRIVCHLYECNSMECALCPSLAEKSVLRSPQAAIVLRQFLIVNRLPQTNQQSSVSTFQPNSAASVLPAGRNRTPSPNRPSDGAIVELSPNAKKADVVDSSSAGELSIKVQAQTGRCSEDEPTQANNNREVLHAPNTTKAGLYELPTVPPALNQGRSIFEFIVAANPMPRTPAKRGIVKIKASTTGKKVTKHSSQLDFGHKKDSRDGFRCKSSGASYATDFADHLPGIADAGNFSDNDATDQLEENDTFEGSSSSKAAKS